MLLNVMMSLWAPDCLMSRRRRNLVCAGAARLGAERVRRRDARRPDRLRGLHPLESLGTSLPSSPLHAPVPGQRSHSLAHSRLVSARQPIMRRFLTRCLGLIPALLVAAAAGRPGIDTLLVASQVVLSIVLPFIVFPLIWFTSSKSIMSVKKPLERESAVSQDMTSPQGSQDPARAEAQVEMVDFANGKVLVVLSYAIWLVIVMANVYAIVGLAMGQGG